jgi:hypothetical protein
LIVVIVDVIGAVMVAALGNGNDIVGVIDCVDAQGSRSFVSIAMKLLCRLRAALARRRGDGSS